MRSLLRLLLSATLVPLVPAVASAATISISGFLGTGTGTLTDARLESRLAELRDSFEQASQTPVSDSTGSGGLSLEVRDELPTTTFGVIEISNREETPDDEAPPTEPSPSEDGSSSGALQAVLLGVPEPDALALLALVGISLAACRRRPIG